MDLRAESPPAGDEFQVATGEGAGERTISPWEPILRLTARAAGARVAWLRLGEETWIVGVAGEVAARSRARALAASRRACRAEYLVEDAAGVSVRGMWLRGTGEARASSGRESSHSEGESGSVGVLVSSGTGREDEIREALREMVKAVAGTRHLRRAAERMSEADRMLTALTHAVVNLPTGVTVTDSDGRIVFTNPAEARMHGYTADELIGSPANTLAPPSVAPGKRRVDRERRPKPIVGWKRESVNQHRDGRRFPVLLWSDAIEEDGEFRGLVTWSQDLTAGRSVADAVRQGAGLFRAAFDDAPAALALLDGDGWIVRANPRLRAMLGLRPQPPRPIKLIDSIHPDDVAATREYIEGALAVGTSGTGARWISVSGTTPRAGVAAGRTAEFEATEFAATEFEAGVSPRSSGTSSLEIECRILSSRVDTVWVRLRVAPIVDTDGNEPLWLVEAEDVTSRRALEERLRRSRSTEAVGRVASGIAHDFNNLLTTIRGLSELLLLESGADHAMADDLRIIQRAAETATDLTRRLLTFSGRERGQQRPRSLSEIARECEPMLRRLVGETIELVLEVDPALAPTMADRGEIEQVILNLIVNARDAMPTGGRVTLRTRNVDAVMRQEGRGARPFVELSVEDTGCGVDPAILDRVFDPFFTTKPVGKGTGLGLATVYGIVRQSGGHVWVESEPGMGTAFRAWFPALDVAAAGEVMNAAVRTVLLATSDPDSRSAVSTTLEGAGYRVLAPSSLAIAHELVEGYGDRIHLLVIDETFGEACGIDVALRMRDFRDDMNILVLIAGDPPNSPPDGIEFLDALTPPDLLLHSIDRLAKGSA